MALTCLWVTSLDQFGVLAGRLGVVGIAAALLVLTLGFACLFRPYQFLQESIGKIMLHVRSAPVENLLLASRLLLVLFCIVLLNKTPEFVYKAF